MPAPILSKPILPSPEKNQVTYIIEQADTLGDKSIIYLFTESGLRLSELTNIRRKDIDGTSPPLGKDRKEAYAPSGELSKMYLRE